MFQKDHNTFFQDLDDGLSPCLHGLYQYVQVQEGFMAELFPTQPFPDIFDHGSLNSHKELLFFKT